MPHFVGFKVGLHVCDLDVGLVRIQGVHVDGVRVLYDMHRVGPEAFCIEVLVYKDNEILSTAFLETTMHILVLNILTWSRLKISGSLVRVGSL